MPADRARPPESSGPIHDTPQVAEVAASVPSLLHALAAISWDAVLVHDGARILDGNQALADLTGYPLKLICGRPLADIMRPVSGRMGALPESSPAEVRHADGMLVPVEVRSRKVQRDGMQDGCTLEIVVIRDITGRQAQELALRASAARLKAIVDTAVDGIITIDEEGTIHSVNPAAERLFGAQSPRLVGQPVQILMGPETAAEHDLYIKRYLETGAGQIIGVGREVEGRRLDGAAFPMELAIGEFLLGDRRFFTGIVRDISERKAAEAAVVRARDTAEAASRAKTEFLAHIGDDLRRPLNTILALADVMAQELLGPLGDPRYREHAAKIEAAGRTLLGALDDLTDISQAEVGAIALADESVDLSTLIDDCLVQMAGRAEERDLMLTSHIPTEFPLVRGDPRRLRQVFLALLSNAIKFTRQGGMVSVHAGRTGDGAVEVSVADTGIGMSADDIAAALGALRQPGLRNTGRSGLGLALVQRLVDLHGGRVAVDSAVGRGTTVTIHLPADRVDPEDGPGVRPAARAPDR